METQQTKHRVSINQNIIDIYLEKNPAATDVEIEAWVNEQLRLYLQNDYENATISDK